MVDIGGKKITSRSAHARTYILLPKELMSLFSEGEINTPKGPVFNTAIVAGVMAAKKTHEFIPFCHQLPSKIKTFLLSCCFHIVLFLSLFLAELI